MIFTLHNHAWNGREIGTSKRNNQMRYKTMKTNSYVIKMTICFLVFGFWSFGILAQTSKESEILNPVRITEKPKIDGILDEKIWQISPLEKTFSSYNPHIGEIMPFKTDVWMAYDNQKLYFAFLCHDPEPHKMKATLTKRDNIIGDDRVGLALDSLGTKQSSWALFSNPCGVQMDILYSAVSEAQYEPDTVWESAGKITDKGYQVEIAIPLTSLTFNSGKEVKMGILFWRSVPRLGIDSCWPEYVPGGKVFGTETTIIYKDLKKPLTFELLPNVVYGSNQERLNLTEWGDKNNFSGVGLDLKYGLTSSLTIDITANPDFSQVESDTFQVEVNQRYPLFYSEKRPFFMDDSAVFQFFTVNSGYFPQAIHTRRILDPQWAAKLTGTIGQATIGIITAGDEWPGRVLERGDKQAFFGIARGKYNIGPGNYIGILYSGRDFAGEYNRVFGADFLLGSIKKHRFQASFLHSNSSSADYNFTNNTANSPTVAKVDQHLKSININLDYFYMTKNIRIKADFEHIGRDFRMDSAYIMRNGINHGQAMFMYNFQSKFKTFNWFKRISPKITYQYIHDLYTGKNDIGVGFGLEAAYSLSGITSVQFLDRRENWLGQTFNLHQFNFFGNVKVTKWLEILTDLYLGDNIYYSLTPFKGKWHSYQFYLDIQPFEKLGQQLDYTNVSFSRGSEKIYNVDIFFSRTTFQFNKYLFLRAMLQYNSYDKRLMTDFLVSFHLIPGTVFYIGYGNLYEKRQWQDGKWLYRLGDLLDIKRSFFLKASYRWRF